MSSTVIPPGFSPALHPISAKDHGGYATIASGCGLVFVLLFGAIRIFNSRRLGFYLSDHALFAATGLTLAQSVIIFLAVDEGFGKFNSLVSDSSVEITARMVYAASLLYIVALFLSKVSLLCLVWRLSVERTHVILAQSSVGATLVAMIASLLMIAFGCNTARPWNQVVDVCSSLFTRWIVVEVLGLLAEVLILLLILRIYRNLQKGWRWKVRGLSVFGLRLGMIPFAVLRLCSLRDVRASGNPLFERVPIVVWTQSALAYSMATATIPCLMAFMIKLNTGWGAFSPDTVMEQSQQDSKNISGGGYELRSIQPSQKSQHATEGRLDDVNYKWAINSRRAEERSIASDDSKNMIIRKTVEFTSKTEEAGQ